MFTVVGAGFGMYGYLPALIECLGEPVILARDFEKVLRARPELQRYQGSVRWVADIESALGQASGVVIAVPPASQPQLVARCCQFPGIGMLVLEKPVADSPAAAAGVLLALRGSNKRYRIGYTLLNAGWLERSVQPGSGSVDPVEVDWTFMAHHFTHSSRTWKSAHSQGGGVLRFYGIHLLALLAHWGYRGVTGSVLAGATPDEPHDWIARFSGPGLPECRVHVDSRSPETAFRISTRTAGRARPVIDGRDPFAIPQGAPDARDGDRRIPVLVDLLGTFREEDGAFYQLYERTNELWALVEGASEIRVGAGP